MPGGLVDEVQQDKAQVSAIGVACWLRERRRAYIQLRRGGASSIRRNGSRHGELRPRRKFGVEA